MYELTRRYKNNTHYVKDRFILCPVWKGSPILRDKDSKWFVSYDDIPRDETFPVRFSLPLQRYIYLTIFSRKAMSYIQITAVAGFGLQVLELPKLLLKLLKLLNSSGLMMSG